MEEGQVRDRATEAERRGGADIGDGSHGAKDLLLRCCSEGNSRV